jgi:hypothetical protein
LDRGCLGNLQACVAVSRGGAAWARRELLAGGKHVLLATSARRGGWMWAEIVVVFCLGGFRHERHAGSR